MVEAELELELDDSSGRMTHPMAHTHRDSACPVVRNMISAVVCVCNRLVTCRFLKLEITSCLLAMHCMNFGFYIFSRG